MNAEPNAALTYTVYAPPSDYVTSVKLIDSRKRVNFSESIRWGHRGAVLHCSAVPAHMPNSCLIEIWHVRRPYIFDYLYS